MTQKFTGWRRYTIPEYYISRLSTLLYAPARMQYFPYILYWQGAEGSASLNQRTPRFLVLFYIFFENIRKKGTITFPFFRDI